MANGLWDYYKRHMMTNTPTNIFELRIGDYMINCDPSCVFDKSVKLVKFPNGECMDIDPDRVYQLLKIYRDARDSL